MWLLIGIGVGLIVGWNLMPQPRWIERIYIRAAQRIGNWLAGLCVLLVLLPGCGSGLFPIDIGYAQQRAMAEIAIASCTAKAAPAPDRAPVVGDKCPDCNDPPGACGVGRTGDGNVCDTCLLCNGDGRIDDRDVTQGAGPPIEPVPDPIPDADPDADPVPNPEPAAERSDDCQCIDCDCDPCRCDTELTLKNFAPLAVDDRTSSELERLEGRVTELEQTAIDVGQAEEIAKRISTKVAEDVIERYVTKLQLGIRSSGGQVRSETVQFSDPSRSQSFQLAPGESLYSYTDLHTGQVVRIGAPTQQVAIQTGSAPVHSWVTPLAELRMQPAPIAMPRRVYVRPVVERIPVGGGPIRRGVIGGWPTRSGSCRIVNGRRVCN